MASFKKLPNGSFQATISCGRDANGKQIRKYVTKPTLKECKAAAREIEREYEEGLLVNIKNMKFSVWLDEWLKLNKNRISPATYLSYKMYIKTHFKPALGNLKLMQINEVHIKKYMNDKLESLSPTTVRKHMFVLRRILQDALKHKNPAKDIKMPSPAEYLPHIITDEEFEKIHNAVKCKKDEIIILLAGWCGLRRGEIFALKWDDIDWKQKLIRVDEGRILTEDGHIDKAPKSKNSIRTVHAPEYLFSLLEQYRSKQKQITRHIFNGRLDDYSHRFKEIVDKIGLNDIRFHDLRHYHASWMYRKGIPDLYAAQRLGDNIQTIKKIYQHIDAGTKKEIDKNIIALIENPGN